MRFLPLIVALALFPLLVKSQDAEDIKLMVPAEKTPVEKWEKVELGVQLPADMVAKIDAFINGERTASINPFDPDQLSVEAEFVQPDGKIKMAYGFYYAAFNRGVSGWQKKRAPYPFRVRIAPGQEGKWKCTVRYVVNQSAPVTLGNLEFECVKGNNKGPVVVNNNNNATGRYLQYSETNEMFFAKSINLLWADLVKLKPEHNHKFEGWIDQLSVSGANYVQISMVPYTYGMEWEALNDYSKRLTHAWEFDQLLEYCAKKGIYINLLTLIHDEFQTAENIWYHENNHWKNNAYNSARNGGLTNAINPADFFSDEKSKAFFKKRLRYILSRYGYSVYLPVIELLSEVDNAIPDVNKNAARMKIFRTWFSEMKNYIEVTLGYPEKIISISSTQNDQHEKISEGPFPLADVVLLHFYGRHKYTNYNNRYVHTEAFRKNNQTKYKPVIFDEMGAGFPGLDKCTDITFHNSLWATSFMGTFGTGQNWWWDNALLPMGYEKNFRGIKKFFDEENFALKSYTPYRWLNKGKKVKNKTKYEAYYLVSDQGEKAIGWVHNTSYWWANLKNTNADIAKFVENNNGSHIEEADHSAYREDYVDGNATGAPENYDGYEFDIKMPLGNTPYIIKWINTVTGEPYGITETITSNRSGKISFKIPQIRQESNPYGDLAFRIVKFSK